MLCCVAVSHCKLHPAQLDDLDSEPHLDHTQEYVIIQNRCERLQAQLNQEDDREQNKKLEFVCAVCFEDCPVDQLRIATPCGHGFCEDCTDALAAAAKADDPCINCPTCRAPVAAVIQSFF
jgi:hypothetical protein